MGLFSEETEFEKECRELIKVIKSFYIDAEAKEYLVNYVSDIKDGKRNNDF